MCALRQDDADLKKLGLKAVSCLPLSQPVTATDALVNRDKRSWYAVLEALERALANELDKQVIGAAGALPQAPPKPVVFMEDMTDLQLAEAVRSP